MRELVRESAVRDDRKLASKELDNVAAWGAVAREHAAARAGGRSRSPRALRRPRPRTRSRSGWHGWPARTCTSRRPTRSGWPSWSRPAPARLPRSRRRGSWAPACCARSSSRARRTDPKELRETANDLCLRTDGKMSKEDVKAIETVGAQGPRHLQRHPGSQEGRRGPHPRLDRPARPHVGQVQGARGPGDHRRRGAVPRAQGPVRQPPGASASTSPAAWARSRSASCCGRVTWTSRRPSCARRSRPRRARSRPARSSG